MMYALVERWVPSKKSSGRDGLSWTVRVCTLAENRQVGTHRLSLPRSCCTDRPVRDLGSIPVEGGAKRQTTNQHAKQKSRAESRRTDRASEVREQVPWQERGYDADRGIECAPRSASVLTATASRESPIRSLIGPGLSIT